MQTKIVNIHPHIVPTDSKGYPITPFGGKQSEGSASPSVSLFADSRNKVLTVFVI